ncbi:MAG: metal ABC transporter permease [Planctomycetaceae bacterium]|nr:metal ABC transporter permease [Planctomycetaceae bacterium]
MNGLLSQWSWDPDGWIVAAGILCAVSSAVLGNFLVLRRMSMLGDAITHAVLPGLAVAFFISESRSSVPMFIGAVVVGILTAYFTEWIRGVGDVDEGASMGVVFTTLFALGLVMVVQAADHVDLDPGCVLYGAIELTPLDKITLPGDVRIPRAVVTLFVIAVINIGFVTIFLKELKISSFDPALATTVGFSARRMHYLLMTLVAVTAVASFESVGNILVVAMFVVPPAAAYMLTDRLSTMIVLSMIIAAVAAVTGHITALAIPPLFGFQSTTTAGMMAVCAGMLFLMASMFGPRHGFVVRFFRQRLLSFRILSDDVVSLLYRFEERGNRQAATMGSLSEILIADRFSLKLVLQWLQRMGEIAFHDTAYALTDAGRIRATELVRSHRLWEHYLVSQAGLSADRIHATAERLEHFTDNDLLGRLDIETESPSTDPHGSEIPATTSIERPATDVDVDGNNSQRQVD